MSKQLEFQRRLGSIEELLHKIESSADPSLRTTAQELIQLVMDLHASGFERMLELVHTAGGAGENIIERLGQDELVASLLVLHGLHPLTLEDRVMRGLEKARSRLKTHGVEMDLLSFQGGVVHLRLNAHGHGCGSTAQSLKQIIEDSLYQAAPDLTSLIVEGAEEKEGFVPLEVLLGGQNGTSLAVNGKGEL